MHYRPHLILYDGFCPLCNKAVRFLLKRDTKKRFLFAPLHGQTALKILETLPPSLDTLVLVENFQKPNQKIFIEGRGVLRICYHLGVKYFLLGLLSLLPTFAFDLMYRFIAKRRYKLFSMGEKINPNDYKDRFLP
jgi:predicted DCC family thiol-disulfide oxidoreductase YuxK